MTPERKSKVLSYWPTAPLLSAIYIILSILSFLAGWDEAERGNTGFSLVTIPFLIFATPFGYLFSYLRMNLLPAFILDAILWAYFTVFVYRWLARRKKVAK